VALVECARHLGFEFVRRTSTHTILNILGEEHQFETLEVMEFSSERQRMSVIVRCPDGTIKLFCKGADAMMLRRIRSNTSDDLLERVKDNLHFFATKGLRTLVIGTRVIAPDYYQEWSQRYDAAQGNVNMDDNAEEQVRGAALHARHALCAVRDAHAWRAAVSRVACAEISVPYAVHGRDRVRAGAYRGDGNRGQATG
jgi:magnesium-transporting ATPase (P-type)